MGLKKGWPKQRGTLEHTSICTKIEFMYKIDIWNDPQGTNANHTTPKHHRQYRNDIISIKS